MPSKKKQAKLMKQESEEFVSEEHSSEESGPQYGSEEEEDSFNIDDYTIDNESGEHSMEEGADEQASGAASQDESSSEGSSSGDGSRPQALSNDEQSNSSSGDDSNEDDSSKPEAPSEKSDDEDSQTFKELGVAQWLVNNLSTVGIVKPTAIQASTLVHSLKGKHVIGCARTGSGKTACFAVPMLQKLAKDPYGVFGLVITPTRELAYQIRDQFLVFSGQNLNLRISVIVGGIDMMKQAQELSNIPHIIICTPGRLVHNLMHDQVGLKDSLENLQYLVFDEADRLLTDECFKPDLEYILKSLPSQEEQPSRQTFLFSATMTQKYDAFISRELLFGKERQAQVCSDSAGAEAEGGDVDTIFARTVQNLKQSFSLVPQNVKESYLVHALKSHKLKKNQQCIIFTSTCKNCHFLSLLLRELDFDVALIHSQLEQRVRMNNILKFKSNFCKYLVATDVASRGLDIPTVELVINFDVPKDPKDYVHRVGRTARAGRGGQSLTFVSQYDVDLILAIEKYVDRKLDKVSIDEDEALEDASSLLKVMQVVRIKMSEQGLDEKFEQFKQSKKRQRQIKSEPEEGPKKKQKLK